MYHFILKWENGTDVPRRDRQCFIGFKLRFFSYKNKEKKGKGKRETESQNLIKCNRCSGLYSASVLCCTQLKHLCS